ncbi:MAG: insulinase family protein [Myxococcales bacterium]|nr:insulinase family protein [Myxococcales bacterium]
MGFAQHETNRKCRRRDAPSGVLRKKRLLGLFTATLCGLVIATPYPLHPVYAQEMAQEMAQLSDLADPIERLRETLLPNGLKIYTLEDHRTPVVSFQVWVQVGSVDETRYTGLAHLFEHMMFKGSKNLGPEQHAQWVQSRGGRINAFTSRDVTVYHEDVTSESLPLVIDLEAERFGNLNIGDRSLTSEREVVLEERRLRSEDSPRGRASEALSALLWKAHPYRRPVIGWRSDIEAVTVEACRAFFKSYYAPNNFIIVVVGDFDSEATLSHIKRSFGALPRGPEIVRTPTVEPEQRGERRATIEFDVKAPMVIAAWHAPPTGHEDGPSLDVAGQILSGGRSSRLYRSLVYDAQLATHARAYYIEYHQAGMFYASAGVRPDSSIDEAESLLFSEIRRMAEEGVDEEEVAKATRQLEVALVGSLATNHALANRIGIEITAFGKVRPLASRLEEIRRVTPADVQRVLRTYVKDDQRSVVRMIPVHAEQTDKSERQSP